MEITLEGLRGLTASETRSFLAEVDTQLLDLHQAPDGSLRSLTAPEQGKFDNLMNLRVRAGLQLDKHDELRSAYDNGGGRNVESAFGGGTPSAVRGGYGEARRVIDDAVRSKLLPDHAAEKALALVERGPARDRSVAASWVRAVGNEHYLGAFAKVLGDPVRGHLLWTAQEQDAYRSVEEYRAMSEGTPSAGGYMVPLTLDPAILLSSAGSNNPLRQISRVVQTITNSWTGVTSAGATAEWKAEAAQAADGSPTLVNPVIPVYLGDSFVPYSFEVGMDAVGFAGELQHVLVDAADQLQATAYTTGTGTTQPTGIITGLVGSGSIVNSAVADTFAKGDVYALQNALPPRFSANAQWCANIATINLMSQMETTAGARLFPELANGQLLSKPISELSNMDGVINAGAENYMLLYGDFSAGFIIADRIGATIELVPQLFQQTTAGTGFGRPTGQRGALLWFRTGSDSVVDNAFRLLDVT